MIDLIGEIFKDRVGGLNFVERFSPFVRPLEKTFEIGTGKDLQFKRETYPIASELNDRECWETGKHLFLVPDSSKSSVCWFEDRSPAQTVLEGSKKGTFNITQSVRFSCWLNLQKLGVHTNDLVAANIAGFELAFMDVIPRVSEAFDKDGITGRISTSNYSVLPQDPKVVFDRYSFKDMPHLFLSPFAFFGVDFVVNMNIPAGF